MEVSYNNGIFTINDSNIVSNFNQSHYMKIYSLRNFGIYNKDFIAINQVISHELIDRVVWREVDTSEEVDIYPHCQ